MSWDNQPDDFRQVKIGFAVGAGLGALVVAWLWVARPSDETVETGGGFNLSGAPGGSVSFDRRGQTGLSMVRPGDAAGVAAAGAPADAASAPASGPLPPYGAAPVSAAGTPVAASTAAAPAAAPGPSDAAALAQIGAPGDHEGLRRLGAERGLLSKLVAGALNHPTALGLLLNNKTLVDAYFSRGLVQQNCASGASLKSYLMNGSDPQGVSEEVSIAHTLLHNPQAAAAAAGTEFGARLMACPSVGQLSSDRATIAQIAVANPALVGLAMNPSAASALASNPQAAAVFGGVQAALAGAGPSGTP